jgi:hypothetical protein
MAIEFQSLGSVLRWSECQAIVKNTVWLKIGRRSKQNLDSLNVARVIAGHSYHFVLAVQSEKGIDGNSTI